MVGTMRYATEAEAIRAGRSAVAGMRYGFAFEVGAMLMPAIQRFNMPAGWHYLTRRRPEYRGRKSREIMAAGR